MHDATSQADVEVVLSVPEVAMESLSSRWPACTSSSRSDSPVPWRTSGGGLGPSRCAPIRGHSVERVDDREIFATRLESH